MHLKDLKMNNEKKQFYNGIIVYELQENKILLKREELTCYHKNEYGYETYRTIVFENENDATTIFREMKQLYQLGWEGGEKHTKIQMRDQMREVLK